MQSCVENPHALYPHNKGSDNLERAVSVSFKRGVEIHSHSPSAVESTNGSRECDDERVRAQFLPLERVQPRQPKDLGQLVERIGQASRHRWIEQVVAAQLIRVVLLDPAAERV